MNNHEKVRPHHDRSPLYHSPYFFYRRCGVGNFCSGYYGLHFYCDFCVRITTRSCATPQGRRHCQGPFHDRGIHKLLASKGSEQVRGNFFCLLLFKLITAFDRKTHRSPSMFTISLCHRQQYCTLPRHTHLGEPGEVS